MNLWAESDNPELSSAPEQARKPGTGVGTRSIASPNAIASALRAWLLADYVAPYCRALAATRIFRRCFWIDGAGATRSFSKKAAEGQGRADALPDIFEGRASSRPQPQPAEQQQHSSSRPHKAAKKEPAQALPPALQPVIALATELARDDKPIALQGFALDGGQRARTHASAPQAAFVLPKESGVLPGGWRETAPTLLPAIDQSAAIFLLNPLEVRGGGQRSRVTSSDEKGEGRPQGSPPHIRSSPAPTKNEAPFLTVDELMPIFQRSAPTEVCLLLTYRQVETVLLPALRTPAGAAAFTALLRSDRWKALPGLASGTAPGMATIEKVIGLWLACLQPHFPFVQRVAFPMLVGPASVEDAPCALLIATRRQDSLFYMNDAVCGYRRRLEEESYQGILNAGWFASQQKERSAQALQQLSEDMLREGRARSPRRWPDLRQQLLLGCFGHYLFREYDEAICYLLQAGEVRCEWRQPQPQPDKDANGNTNTPPYRIPGAQDILLWQEKKRWARSRP